MKGNYQFRINTGFLVNASVGEYREFDIAAPSLKVDEDILFTEIQTVVRVSRVQQGILVSLKASANIDLDCVRCLEPFAGRVSCTFDDLYAFHMRQNSDADNFLPENAVIDLEPLLKEYLVLELPINPICSADCKGLCPECGANLNIDACEHQVKDEA